MKGKNALKLNFFLIIMSTAAYKLFFPIYLKHDLGFSEEDVGLILAISPLISIVISPIWGYILDYYKRSRLILFILLIGSSISVYFISFALTFTTIIFSILLFSLFNLAISPIQDTITIKFFKSSEGYSSARLFAPIGYVFGSLFTAYILNEFTNFPKLFLYFSSFLYAVAALVVFKYPKIDYKEESNKDNLNIKKSIKTLVNNNSYLILSIIAIAIITVSNVSNSYAGLRIMELGGTKKEVGYLTIFQTVPEILLLKFNSVKKGSIDGRNLLIFITSIVFIRWSLYFLMPSLIVFLVLSTIHGLMMGLLIPYVYSTFEKIISKQVLSFGITLYLSFSYIVESLLTYFSGLIGYTIGLKYIYLLYTLCVLFIFPLVFKSKKSENKFMV